MPKLVVKRKEKRHFHRSWWVARRGMRLTRALCRQLDRSRRLTKAANAALNPIVPDGASKPPRSHVSRSSKALLNQRASTAGVWIGFT